MADFWGMLGKSVPKKGYSKYGKSIDKKVTRASKSAARKRKSNVAQLKKEKAQKARVSQKASKPKPEPKWHPVRTYQNKQQALSAAESLRKAQGCPTRVDGTARGYQVWIKS